MKKTLKPFEDRIIVKPDQTPDEIKGIIIPEASKERFKPSRGTVLAVGPGKKTTLSSQPIGYFVNDVFQNEFPGNTKLDDRVVEVYPMSVKVGDRVMYAHSAGTSINVGDGDQEESVLIMRITDVFGDM